MTSLPRKLPQDFGFPSCDIAGVRCAEIRINAAAHAHVHLVVTVVNILNVSDAVEPPSAVDVVQIESLRLAIVSMSGDVINFPCTVPQNPIGPGLVDDESVSIIDPTSFPIIFHAISGETVGDPLAIVV